MGFRINTNVSAMNAHMYSLNNNKRLNNTLAQLSSGLRINKAADDASGLAIADSLRSQANGLGQAIRNANDGINLAQTADGALDEYSKIISTVRTKAIQAASDGQNVDSRKAIQQDINKLLQEAQNIAKTTSFNGQNLLDGTFTNKSFHIGAYKDETVGISISNVQTNTIGQHVNKAGGDVNSNANNSAAAAAFTTSTTINGIAVAASAADTTSGANTTAHSAGSAWAKAISINSIENTTGVHATAETTVTGSAVTGGTLAAGDLKINGIDIGAV
ncbi:MAG: flagellin, partial [Sulfurospirillum sp.]